MAINNESIGISAEVAIARSFGVRVNPYYEARSEPAIVNLLLKNDNVKRIFYKEEYQHQQNILPRGRILLILSWREIKPCQLRLINKDWGRLRLKVLDSRQLKHILIIWKTIFIILA